VLPTLSPSDRATLTSTSFFPHLISLPFHHGLTVVFSAAAVLAVLAALASMARGPRTASAGLRPTEAPAEEAVR
jgi:hypothetical protein